MILPPHVRREQIRQRGDRAAPRDLRRRDLQPFRMLVEHRVDQVDEGLVGAEEAVPTGQEVALEPPLAGVLAQDLHDAPLLGEVVVLGKRLCHPDPVRHLEHCAEAVGLVFVGREGAKVPRLLIELREIPQEDAERLRRLRDHVAGCRHVDGVLPEVRHAQVAQQQAAVRVGVRSHPA